MKDYIYRTNLGILYEKKTNLHWVTAEILVKLTLVALVVFAIKWALWSLDIEIPTF